MKTKILEIDIKGTKSPRINIRGLLCKEEEVIVKIDGRKVKYEDITYSNHYVVFRKYTKTPQFLYQIEVKPKSKKLEIVVKNKRHEEVILEKNISKLSLIKEELKEKIYFIKKIIKATLRVGIHILKNLKKITSKNFIKECYKTWRYRIGLRHIEKKYYFPMIERDYLAWLNENKEDLEIKEFKYNPLISVLIPVYNTKPEYLKECIDSVLNQTYKNFEVCIANDKSTNIDTINALKEYKNVDKIKIVNRTKNGNISAATNSALELASGEFIALLDNDDVLDENALYEVVKVLNKDKEIDFIYTDEDKISLNGNYYFPNFKPSFSPDTLLSENYICHLSVIRKEIVDSLNGFRSEFDGAQDHDLFLRVSERTNKIHHISKILYHWRESTNSTALNINNKVYALEVGKKVIEDALKRRKISADVEILNNIGKYFINYKLKNEPKVSIIIPTKNRSDILDKCLKSIYDKSTYKNFEIIVIDNNSDEESLFSLLDNYKKKYKNFNSYRYECEFNYSYLNNEAVKLSSGEYILLLNNDTEVITPDFLKIMVGYASQKHIGCVGAKLLYPSKNIQHIGVVSGMGGVASHTYVNAPRFETGYMGSLAITRDVKIVTAACLMVKKSLYNKLNGLDENLKVAYNDVDFNVRVRKEGYYNVIVPSVELYHYESVSRGSDLAPTTKERFNKEVNYVVDKLKEDLMNDEFYNDNFSKDYWYVLDRR